MGDIFELQADNGDELRIDLKDGCYHITLFKTENFKSFRNWNGFCTDSFDGGDYVELEGKRSDHGTLELHRAIVCNITEFIKLHNECLKQFIDYNFVDFDSIGDYGSYIWYLQDLVKLVRSDFF